MKLALLFLIVCSVSFGQKSIYDTIYHPFNDGVQIIELKSSKYNYTIQGFTTSFENKESPTSKFLLRNEAGEALKEYNDFDSTLNADILRKSKYMHGYYEFQQGDKWGFINYKLDEILPAFSPSPNLFRRDGHFQYHKAGNWILIDSTGHVLLDSPHEVYLVITKKRFLVTKYTRKNGYERSIVNQKREIISEIIYHDIWRVNDHTLFAGYQATFHDDSDLRKSTKWVLLDENGTRINSKIYKYLIPLNDKWIKASEKKGELRVIDEKGADVLGYEVDDIYMYREDLFKIGRNKKHQFIDLANPKKTFKEYDNLRCVNGNFFRCS